MKLFNTLTYEKPKPFRDSALFIIICEGANRETDYFEFFDRLSRRIKVHSYSPNKHKSSPNHVIRAANEYLLEYQDESIDETFDSDKDQFWLVMDTDDHEHLIHDVIKECNDNGIMNYAISNPCFEVWLRYHFEDEILSDEIDTCQEYKKEVAKVDNNGGFDSARHPTLIETANQNASENLNMEGYLPSTGSTTLFLLGREIYQRVKSEIRKYNP